MSYSGMTPIEELKFSMRTYNCLRRGKIRFVEELSSKSADELLTIRGLGESTLREIMQVLGVGGESEAKKYKMWEVLKMLHARPSRVFMNNFGTYITLKASKGDEKRFELFDPVAKKKVDIGYVYLDQKQCHWKEVEIPKELSI